MKSPRLDAADGRCNRFSILQSVGAYSADCGTWLIETLVAEATVQALDETVLHRLARRATGPLDALVFLPLQDHPRSQFGAVVADAHKRPSADIDERIEFASDTLAGERGIDHDKHAEAPASASWAATKLKLPRWFDPCGKVIGALVPRARLRPPRRRTVSRPSL